MAAPLVHEVDALCAKHLHEVDNQLKRAFAEGLASVRDMEQTLKVLSEVQQTVDKELAVERTLGIREQMVVREEPASGGGKSVAVMVDGSANSLTALKWAVETLLDPEDNVFCITVTPFQDFQSDAERILRDAFDYLHNAGVRASRIHVRTLAAKGSSATSGIGESITEFMDANRMDLVVLGSRGLGSIKRQLLSSVGMGSVSDFCVQHLKCPIIVVKLEEGAEGVQTKATLAEPPQVQMAEPTQVQMVEPEH